VIELGVNFAQSSPKNIEPSKNVFRRKNRGEVSNFFR
jgi:hypothetical protein